MVYPCGFVTIGHSDRPLHPRNPCVVTTKGLLISIEGKIMTRPRLRAMEGTFEGILLSMVVMEIGR